MIFNLNVHVVVFSLFIFNPVALGQVVDSGTAEAKFLQIVSEIERDAPAAARILDQDYESADVESLLNSVEAHLTHPIGRVRLNSMRVALTASLIQPSEATHRRVSDILCDGLTSADFAVSQSAIRLLIQFKNSGEFSEEARGIIRSEFENYRKHRTDFVKLAGSAGLTELRSQLLELSADMDGELASRGGGKWYGTYAWNSSLALARLGSDEHAAYCTRVVKAASPRERFRSLSDLAYTRHEIAIEYLYELLQSDESLAGNGDVLGVRVADLAIRSLAFCFDDFPNAMQLRRNFPVQPGDLAICREWMQGWRSKIVVR